MKRLLALVIGCAMCVAYTTQSLAAEVWHTGLVSRIYPQDDGGFVVTFQTDPASCTNTAAPKYLLVRTGANFVTDEGSRKIYAAVMLAFAMGKTLAVAFDNSTSDCAINRAFVSD